MGESDAADLRELTDRCDRAAADIVAAAATPMPAGPPNQATSEAVAQAHALVQSVSTELARRLSALSDVAGQAAPPTRT